MQNKTPYKFLLQQQNNHKKNGHKRSTEQIETLSQLIVNNQIFQYFGIGKHLIKGKFVSKLDICEKIVLIWADHPHINQTTDNQIYLILDGKAFEYMQNKSPSLKAKLHENDDYVMVRKLTANDFFIEYSPPRKYSNQINYRKYQLMVDQQTLIGKISGEIFQRIFLQLIDQRWKSILNFARKVTILNALPNLMIYQLSKYMRQVTYSRGNTIIQRQQKSQSVYFIQSGEVQYRSFKNLPNKQSPSKNYYTSYTKGFHRQILKENDVFGIDTFSPTTYQQIETEYSAESKTNCLLYCIDKRILAIVISSFQEMFQKSNKVYSLINLNEQISGQGYKTIDMQALQKNAQTIKTSQRKIRDIKLKYLNKSKKSGTAGKIFDDQADIQDLTNYKYDSCHSLTHTKIKVNRGESLKFSETFHSKSRPSLKYPYSNPMIPSEVTKPTVNHVNMSIFHQNQYLETPSLDNQLHQKTYAFSPSKTMSSFHLKRKNQLNSHGKEESDIIRAYLQKKLKNEMLKKAQFILQRNITKKSKQKMQVKRLFNCKNIRSKTTKKASLKQNKNIGQQLYNRMNKLSDNPLLSLIESQRKKLDYNSRLSQRKSKQRKQQASKKTNRQSHALILISNN